MPNQIDIVHCNRQRLIQWVESCCWELLFSPGHLGLRRNTYTSLCDDSPPCSCLYGCTYDLSMLCFSCQSLRAISVLVNVLDLFWTWFASSRPPSRPIA